MHNEKNIRDVTEDEMPQTNTKTMQRQMTEHGEIRQGHMHQDEMQQGERTRSETGAGE